MLWLAYPSLFTFQVTERWEKFAILRIRGATGVSLVTSSDDDQHGPSSTEQKRQGKETFKGSESKRRCNLSVIEVAHVSIIASRTTRSPDTLCTEMGNANWNDSRRSQWEHRRAHSTCRIQICATSICRPGQINSLPPSSPAHLISLSQYSSKQLPDEHVPYCAFEEALASLLHSRLF
ncbi:hypothetical protein CC78DRAFT_574674 [Lojkania enalia]|uniref:Uncharacterized protein n=1 Tax=Lojkania enalia TaxID=147567 RepID=A0A9P4NB47_9PLEO|nr:hypothetical protein CC78DRAFT_574674 [Didymosphaeria enalia]